MSNFKVIVIMLFAFVLSSCGSKVEVEFELNEGIDTIEFGETWIDEGASLTIDEESYTPTVSGTVDNTTLGLYTITYAYTHDETEYTAIRYVIVVDQTDPVLTLNAGIDTIHINEDWVDSGATVVDNSGEELTVVMTGNVVEETIGTYIITYTATDSSGNTYSITRVVHVIE